MGDTCFASNLLGPTLSLYGLGYELTLVPGAKLRLMCPLIIVTGTDKTH